MRCTDHRQEGGAVGLLPTPGERLSPGRRAMTAEDRPITRDDAWALLAVAYAGWEGRGADVAAVQRLARSIRREVLAEESLGESLGRLRDAGLVVESGGLHHPAATVADFLRARTHRRGVRHDHRDLMHHVGLD
jgi:hypothetical protein